MPYFLCEWDSRIQTLALDKERTACKKIFKSEIKICGSAELDSKEILLPPLYIKLGLIKQLVKDLDKTGDCFQYLNEIFSHLLEGKIQESVLDGPEIRWLVKDEKFV